MGIFDRFKDQAKDKAKDVSDSVEEEINEKTGGKYSDQIGKGADAIKNAIPEHEQPETPPSPASEPPDEG